MKCIARNMVGERYVMRVDDARAENAVKNSGCRYVAKHVWKEAGRPAPLVWTTVRKGEGE